MLFRKGANSQKKMKQKMTETLPLLVGSLVSVREKMKGAATAWRSAFTNAKVLHAIDFVRYGDRTLFELYFEILHPTEGSACWWIDIEWKEQNILVNASLRRKIDLEEADVWDQSVNAQSDLEAFQFIADLFDEIADIAHEKPTLFRSAPVFWNAI